MSVIQIIKPPGLPAFLKEGGIVFFSFLQLLVRDQFLLFLFGVVIAGL